DANHRDSCPDGENQRPIEEAAEKPALLALRPTGWARARRLSALSGGVRQDTVLRRQRKRRSLAPGARRIEMRLYAPAFFALAHTDTLAPRSNSTQPRLEARSWPFKGG